MKDKKKLPRQAKALITIVLCVFIVYITIYVIYTVREISIFEAEQYSSYHEAIKFYLPAEAELRNQLDTNEKFDRINIGAYQKGTLSHSVNFGVAIFVETIQELEQAKNACEEYIPAYVEALIAYNKKELGDILSEYENNLVENLVSKLDIQQRQLLKEDWGRTIQNRNINLSIEIVYGYYDENNRWSSEETYHVETIKDLKESAWTVFKPEQQAK